MKKSNFVTPIFAINSRYVNLEDVEPSRQKVLCFTKEIFLA
jgi:hypothetical protein